MKKVHIVIKIISFYYIGSCMAQSGDWEYFDVSDGLASNNVRAIAVDGDNIWFGTFGGGLSRYKKSTNIWETFDLSDSLSNMVSAVTVEGNHIWIGTDLGVGRFNKNTKELKYWSHIQCISDVVIDYNEVWCSTFGKGVYRYTKANGMWTHFDTTNCELLSNVVSDLGIQGDKIWCATKAGVSSYDRSSNNWQNYTPDNCQIAGNDLFSLEIDGNTIWFGHVPMPVNPDTIGSYSYTHTSTIYYYSNCTQMVLTEGKIWPSIIRFPSISQFQTHQNKWEYYECVWIDNSSDEKYSYLVSDIAADNESVWFASVGRGVFKLDKSTGIITNFNTTNSNLIEDYIWTIAVDGNYIWVGTSEKGVCRYRMSTSLWKCYQLERNSR